MPQSQDAACFMRSDPLTSGPSRAASSELADGRFIQNWFKDNGWLPTVQEGFGFGLLMVHAFGPGGHASKSVNCYADSTRHG
eukprot:510991-Pyramimonas_sp.AAC.1